MKPTEDLRQYGLDSLELKALSVPASLRFLLGIEYDVVLCVNEVGVCRPFRIHFPVFAPTFRKLLMLCATRFGLNCVHSDRESVLSGTAVMPLLRYADFLPGALHVKEILECLQVESAAKATRWHSAAVTSSPGAVAAEDGSAGNGTAAAATNEFVASFIDYREFASDSSLDDVHGLGFYLMLDYGLSLATHSHLIGIRFHKDWDAKEALREFQDFSGWEAFDLRFLDEQRRQDGGVIVMPSSQDACDLLEKYEDEDSDDDGDLLPFILRPVSPLVSVPSLEDSALRKLREQHWAEVERHWAHLPHTLNTVVVYNLYDGATLREILTFFDTLPVTASEFVEDDAPSHRRRAFLTFATLEATRKALDVDGKNTRGCTLRVQVSPPYISASRRGHAVKADRAAVSTTATGSSPKLAAHSPNGGSGKAGATTSSPSTSPATRAADHAAPSKIPGGGVGAGVGERAVEAAKTHPNPRDAAAPSAAAAAPTATTTPSASAAGARPATMSTAAPAPATAAPPAFSAARPVNASAAIAGAIAARAHAGAGTVPSTDALHAAPAYASSAPIALPKAAHNAAGAEHEAGVSVGSTSSSHGPTHMNAAAKEFVPQFHLSATSPEYHPSPAPKPDMLYGFNSGVEAAGGPGSLPPPPPPPPPAYGNILSPPGDYRPTPRSTQVMHGAVPLSLPAYALPPPYLPGEEPMEDALPPPPLPPPY